MLRSTINSRVMQRGKSVYFFCKRAILEDIDGCVLIPFLTPQAADKPGLPLIGTCAHIAN
jgi:hypothetical protein